MVGEYQELLGADNPEAKVTQLLPSFEARTLNGLKVQPPLLGNMAIRLTRAFIPPLNFKVKFGLLSELL